MYPKIVSFIGTGNYSNLSRNHGIFDLDQPECFIRHHRGQSPLEVITPCRWTYRKRCRRREWQLSFCGAIWKQHPQVAPQKPIKIFPCCTFVQFFLNRIPVVIGIIVRFSYFFLDQGALPGLHFWHILHITIPFQSAPNRLV